MTHNSVRFACAIHRHYSINLLIFDQPGVREKFVHFVHINKSNDTISHELILTISISFFPYLTQV